MNAELFARTVEPFLHKLVRDSGLQLTYSLKSHSSNSTPLLTVEFHGADVPVLLTRNAELLLAMEHLAAKCLRLESEQHDLISFDADGFKASREHSLATEAEHAVQQVVNTGQPYHFAPMSSRERRLLHLALAPSGLIVGSEGEGRLRHVVVSSRQQ